MNAEAAALLPEFLSAYWLRPETAALLALRSQAMTAAGLGRFGGPVLDISCGDGLFSFLHLGGRPDPAFDVHILDGQAAEGDLYDRFQEDYRPAPRLRPRQDIDLGLDFKPNLLRRAATLGLYGRLETADVTRPLPLPDASFSTILNTAAINHYPDDAMFLAESFRVLKPGGVMAMVLHATNLVRLYERLEGRFPTPWLARFERGMRGAWPLMHSWQEWRDRFAGFGFEVCDIRSIGSQNFCTLWNVGFRPLAGPLTRMKELARHSDAVALAALKADWVETLALLLAPFLEQGKTPDDTAELLYVLRKPEDAA